MSPRCRRGEKDSRASIVARGDAPVVLQPAEHGLDGVTVSVKEGREAVLPFAIGLGRDIRHRADILDLPMDGVAVATFAAMQDITGGHLRQKLCASGAIGDIAAAHFLQRFVGKTPWAHLDIAGTGMGSPMSDTNQSWGAGWGAGWGVRLLDRLVRDYYEG